MRRPAGNVGGNFCGTWWTTKTYPRGSAGTECPDQVATGARFKGRFCRSKCSGESDTDRIFTIAPHPTAGGYSAEYWKSDPLIQVERPPLDRRIDCSVSWRRDLNSQPTVYKTVALPIAPLQRKPTAPGPVLGVSTGFQPTTLSAAQPPDRIRILYRRVCPVGDVDHGRQ